MSKNTPGSAEPLISVITATFNSMTVIEALAQSLSAQTFRSFDWIICDGGSTDGTVSYLQEYAARNSWCRLTVERDFGIYDALNKGVVLSTAQYYVVVGSDDILFSDALSHYAQAVASDEADVVLAGVEKQGKTCKGFYPDRAWLGHQQVFRGSHSVGMLFRRNLHDSYGRYSNRFPLLADGYFLKKLLSKGSVVFVTADFVAGRFAYGGASTTGAVQSLAETWQIQLLTEKHPMLQTMLFFAKVVIRLLTTPAAFNSKA